jgi:hypothetical protein
MARCCAGRDARCTPVSLTRDFNQIDFTVPAANWPVIDTVLTNLTREYSRQIPEPSQNAYRH